MPLKPFYTDKNTAKALLNAAKAYAVQQTTDKASGINPNGVNTQFQNTCKFQITSEWKQEDGAYYASARKVLLFDGQYVTRDSSKDANFIIYTNSTNQPEKNETVTATRRANRWELIASGGGTSGTAVLVEPKEFFSAREYKSTFSVYGLTIEASIDKTEWVTLAEIDPITERLEIDLDLEVEEEEDYRYYKINLAGTSEADDEEEDGEEGGNGVKTYANLFNVDFYRDKTKAELEDELTVLQNASEPDVVAIAAKKKEVDELSDYDAYQKNTAAGTPYKITPAENGWKAYDVDKDPAVEGDLSKTFYSGKPSRNALEDDEPFIIDFGEVKPIRRIVLDIEPANDHYIVAPGGRNAAQAALKFVYSFNLVSEQWRAREFPLLNKAVYLADCAVTENDDGTHTLTVSSGMDENAEELYALQFYKFETNETFPPVKYDKSLGEYNFSGRPMTNIEEGWLAVYGGGASSMYRSDRSLYSAVFFIDVVNQTIEEAGLNGYIGTAYDASSNDSLVKEILLFSKKQTSMLRGVHRPTNEWSSGSANFPAVSFISFGGVTENSTQKTKFEKSVVSWRLMGTTGNSGGDPQKMQVLTNESSKYSPSGVYGSQVKVYPDTPVVVNECCVEYYEKNDWAIIIGGRASTNSNTPSGDVLVFHFGTETYLPPLPPEPATANEPAKPERPVIEALPHPRWNAASCLVNDLVRTTKGETMPCDRLFIIGGRNADGLVAETDVYNLTTGIWETDWAGLDSGEQESVAGIGGSGGTVIVGGGGSGKINSITGKDAIKVTGEKDVVISADLEAIAEEILNDPDLIDLILDELIKNQKFKDALVKEFTNNQTFKTAITQLLINDASFQSTLVQNLTNSNTFKTAITQFLVGDVTFRQNIANEIISNQSVLTQIINDVANNTTFINSVVNSTTLHTAITNELTANTQIINDIVNSVLNNPTLIQNIVDQLSQDITLIQNIANTFVNNEEFRQDIINEIIENHIDTVINSVINSETLIQNITENIVNNETLINTLVTELINNETVINNISQQILGEVFLRDTAGNSIAENEHGVITVQNATNGQSGIAKGQNNNSPTTWNNVSFADGLGSINRAAAEQVMDTKDTAVKNTINVKAVDNSIVGQNINGMINLPIRFVTQEPATPEQGTLYLIKE